MAFNIYEEVTNRIIAQLEKGVIPWRKTWDGSEPINYITRKGYKGINLLLLPYGGEWLTLRRRVVDIQASKRQRREHQKRREVKHDCFL